MIQENAIPATPMHDIVTMPFAPYYDHDGITIYHADCRKVIANVNFDLVLTDPPYGIEGSSGAINKKRAKGDYDKSFTDDRFYIESVVVPVVWTCRTLCGCVVVTPGNKWMCLYPPADSFGTFFQPAATGLQVFGNLDSQPILYYGKNASGKNMGVQLSYRVTEPPSTQQHPCAKPINVWRKLLGNVSQEGQVVLDPFMGSGTTLVAARLEGRKAIGIEISERYCEVAANRLSQGSLF